LSAKAAACLNDARIVGRHYHLLGTAFARLFPDMLDHRFSGNVLQRFAGQAARGVTRRNNNGKNAIHLLVQALIDVEGTRFAFQHHWDAIAYRKSQTIDLADQLGLVGGKLQRALAQGASQYIE
jgi:hypothetical protein